MASVFFSNPVYVPATRRKSETNTMRFMNLGDQGEPSLTGDLQDNPYAMLSHTWGADSDEVTFNDPKDGSGKSKANYAEFQFWGTSP